MSICENKNVENVMLTFQSVEASMTPKYPETRAILCYICLVTTI